MEEPLLKGGGRRKGFPTHLRWGIALACCSCAVMIAITSNTVRRSISAVSVVSAGASFPAYTSNAPYLPPSSYLPPTYVLPPAPLPSAYPTVQSPTVWNGGHVLSASQREWAAEDAAQHALNLADWRIKLLKAKLKQAKLSMKVMNVGVHETHHRHHWHHRHHRKQASDAELRNMAHSVAALASETSHALKLLATQAGLGKAPPMKGASRKADASTYHKQLLQLKDDTDKQLEAIMQKIDSVSGKHDPKRQ